MGKQAQNTERRAKRKTAQAYKRVKYEQKMQESTKYRVIKPRKTYFLRKHDHKFKFCAK